MMNLKSSALVCCLNGFSFKSNEPAFYFKISVLYEVPVNDSPIIFPVVGIIWPFHYKWVGTLSLDLIHTEQEGKMLSSEK